MPIRYRNGADGMWNVEWLLLLVTAGVMRSVFFILVILDRPMFRTAYGYVAFAAHLIIKYTIYPVE